MTEENNAAPKQTVPFHSMAAKGRQLLSKFLAVGKQMAILNKGWKLNGDGKEGEREKSPRHKIVLFIAGFPPKDPFQMYVQYETRAMAKNTRDTNWRRLYDRQLSYVRDFSMTGDISTLSYFKFSFAPGKIRHWWPFCVL